VRRRWSLPVVVVLVAGLLAAGVPVRDRLLAERQRTGVRGVELDKLPPLGAAGVLLLGGFRGVAVYLLWHQVIALHQQRQYEEERTFIELIARLQPYCISVWVFQAWNIAYNISVQYPDAADQWQWVRNGIDFLKEGLRLNAESGDIHFYLAVLHRDKVSQNPYFEDAMERDLGVNNFEEAARYFDRARHLGGVQTFHPRVVDSGVFHAWLSRVQQILRRGELTATLDFTPETLAAAQPFIRKAREESEGLQTRWPKDAAFEMFPARVDVVLADGYVAHVNRVLTEGDFSETSIVLARQLVDKALAELDRHYPKYKGTRSELVFTNKTSDACSRIPWALVRAAGEMMQKPFAGPDEWRRARGLVTLAEREINRLPEPLQQCRDVQALRGMLSQWLKMVTELIEKHGRSRGNAPDTSSGEE